MRWRFWRRPKSVPKPQFSNYCPACGWDFEISFACRPDIRPYHLKWLPSEQALQIKCPSCGYTWKRLAEESERAFVLGARFEEKS